MIEDRLRETFDRVAAGGPAEAGAFDRFQRHRRTHRSRSRRGRPQALAAWPADRHRPLQGFEVGVPAGWEASATWKGIELRPASPELRPT
jgi:hypothetical protein